MLGFTNSQCVCLVSVLQRIRGTVESLYVLTKAGDTRFEFIFTYLVCILSSFSVYVVCMA